jgi:hypothetical protein
MSMRKLFVVLAVGALVAAGQASAAPLGSASFSFQLGTLPGASFPATGATGASTSNLSVSLNAGSAFQGTFTTTIPTSAAPPLTAIQIFVTNNVAGAFVGGAPNSVGGNMSVNGTANVYGIGGFPSGGAPLLAVPLNIGAPNTVTKIGGGVAITAVGAGWTAGQVVITGTGDAGTGMATQTGANGLTPGGVGTLVLVSPTKIFTNIAGTLAAFGVLSLTYVPEPGTLLLLGLGVAGLAAIGRRRA